MSTSERRTCQNCKQEFIIEPDDFGFYERMQVPPPTFCPQCRFQRRLMFRNERRLYKRKCGLCGKDIVTVFAPDKPLTVYCQPCWWSDKWDPLEYGREYDPARPFFEQFRELQLRTPYMSLITSYQQLVNSEYINHAGNSKNCYLIFNADYCENVLYSKVLVNNKDSMDCTMLGESELCYENINCGKCSRVFYAEDCMSCHDVYFSKLLTGCTNCFGCVNLRNKSYCIWNQQYTKEEYEQKIREFNLDSYSSIQELISQARAFWQKSPHKFNHGLMNVNSSGDYIHQCKNSRYMYQCRFAEDCKFCQFITMKTAKDCYDHSEWGNGAERIYESATVGEGASNVRFCFGVWFPSLDVEYSMFTLSSSHMFGCANIKSKEYCILNRPYAKTDYEALRQKIIEDMNTHPYMDNRGRVFKYGEYGPLLCSAQVARSS